MNRYKSLVAAIALFASIVYSCGSGKSGGTIISTPVENIDNTPLKFSVLTEEEKRNWQHLDMLQDTIPGMSVDKAYAEIVKNKKGKTIIVAVIDSGIDIGHEDLDGVIWKNSDEVANNGKDDDNNGYVDDVHGWNFLGDGYHEQMEYTRIVAKGNTNDPMYSEALKDYNEAVQKYSTYKSNYEELINEIKVADNAISQHLGKQNYTRDEVVAIKTQNESLARSVAVIKYVYSLDFESVNDGLKEITSQLDQINNWLNYRLNKDFNGRKTGDDPDNLADRKYGNGNVKPIGGDEDHGTSVASLIAAERNNNKGLKGVANNVKIMSLRAVNGADEYDKDIALAIRYAVDNGANIINMSFGKDYSPHKDWVKDAIKYAADKNVLLVHASGNDGMDVDANTVFPNDNLNGTSDLVNNYISVGALNETYGSGLLADYSNYGARNVDVFAPGSQVYAAKQGNEYDYVDGTSFASPNVAGVAALVWSQYPNLTASQIKNIIIDSGLELSNKVSVGGNPKDVRLFKELSKSGRIVNAYNALILASQVSAQ